MNDATPKVSRRDEKFATKLETKIAKEIANGENPYLADTIYFSGYEHLELMEKKSFTDIIFLLFKGELPSQEDAQLFNQLFIAFINPGLRHPGVQAAISTSVGKTMTEHVLPIALNVYSGEFDGQSKISNCIKFFRKSLNKSAVEISKNYEKNKAPGFSTLYGDADPYAEKLLHFFSHKYDRKILSWLKEFNDTRKKIGDGITKPAVCAAILSELGFFPKQALPIMQLMAAPGLAAHGAEYSGKPLTSMLFEADDHYELQTD